MKKIVQFLFAAVAALFMISSLSCAQVQASEQANATTPVHISDAYSFAVPADARSAAVFLTITYPETLASGDVTDRLLSAETAVSENVEIHTTLIENDVMMMRRMESLPLPPTGRMILAPGGAHIMLLNMKRALNAGETFPMTLVFEKAGAISVDVLVRAPGDVPAHDDHHSESSDHHAHH